MAEQKKGKGNMASIKKFTETAVVNQLRHIERSIKNPSNQDINPEKSGENYSLMKNRGISSYEYYKKRKSELYCYKRSDVKVMASWVVTAPKELHKSEHAMFFEAVYSFLSGRYGEKNCIQAIVHNDESGQPHLHYCFIPVVADKKHGGEKICANDLISKQELRNFHPALEKYLKEKGIDANVHSGVTKKQGGNRSVREMKRDRTYIQTVERRRW